MSAIWSSIMLIGMGIIDVGVSRKVDKRADKGITRTRLLFRGFKKVLRSFIFINRIKTIKHDIYSRKTCIFELAITASPKPKYCELKGQRILMGLKRISPIKGCDKVATK